MGEDEDNELIDEASFIDDETYIMASEFD